MRSGRLHAKAKPGKKSAKKKKVIGKKAESACRRGRKKTGA